MNQNIIDQHMIIIEKREYDRLVAENVELKEN